MEEIISQHPSHDYSARIKRLRGSLGLTQQALAERLGVSFATINRWENGQTKPTQLYWHQLRSLAFSVMDQGEKPVETPNRAVMLDFTAKPESVKVLAEGERLSFGHLFNPVFATEISSIEPLPHQRIAVYDHMLKQPRLRFLLADDAGAGKTIMTGLYIREMIARRLLRRILIVPPAGLVGNWQQEMRKLFSLPFRIVTGADARHENPFVGENGDRVIISADTLSSPRAFARLQHPEVAPYDLVVFDEAHKLAADRSADLRVRKTDRYRLAEALAGVEIQDDSWCLGWCAHHLLLLTATPHMGKDYPYYALWRLLEPEVLATPEAFQAYPAEQRRMHFIRRAKEEMVNPDGKPLYPPRRSDTFMYSLSRGEISEQKLYDETADYLRFVYNKAKMLNREAARLAMSVFQRRLASSTYALLRSLERRLEKLDKIIADIQDGKLTMEQLLAMQRRIKQSDDVFMEKTADEENIEAGYEENETGEDKLLGGIIAASLADLLAEKEQVRILLDLAKKVLESGHESKFEKLREILDDERFAGEKLIVFTEHRDTLNFLVQKLNGLGYTGQIAQIHGGMDYLQREQEVEHFRQPLDRGGARFLICTDAAGEGINLQFCWIMINYDVPWNPARLEQRMGRIHRYGQKHDQVIIMNLVAASTREGKVLKTLLTKLEKIRKEIRSDKVFDCIGRVFAEVSIAHYMELAVTGDPDRAARELDGRLTKEQVEALAAREKSLYGEGGDVARELPRLKADLEQEVFLRLMPGYVRHYLQEAARLVGIEFDGDMDNIFTMRPVKPGAMDPLLPALELYPEKARETFSVVRPVDAKDIIWLHPGEPLFERFRALVGDRLADEGQRGAVFIDPGAEKPYLFHMARISVIRKADPEISGFGQEEALETRLIGIKQGEGTEITLCPVEHLLLLKDGGGLPPSAQRLAIAADADKELARAYLVERVAREMAVEHRKRLQERAVEQENFLRRGFDYEEAELAAARAKHTEKARSGNKKALEALEEVKRKQRQLAGRRETALAALRREPELIAPGPMTFVAHALVVPSSDPDDLKQHEANVEKVAMQIAQAYEESAGGRVIDVHTPDKARAAGLLDNPGFDLLSVRPGNERSAIEVKGRAGTGDIEVTANEWAKACNLRDGYWLYIVYDCATPAPRLLRIRDPFGRLLASSKGNLVISAKNIIEAHTRDLD
ncbi:MAG: helicase-related protein [Bacteroidota bacterium]